MYNTLRNRFFKAISEQETITFPDIVIEDENITTMVHHVVDPFVYTSDGDFYVYWHEGNTPIPTTWFDNVYASGHKTLVVFAEIFPEDIDDEQMAYIVKEGGYMYDGRTIYIYSRVQ